MFLHFSSWLFLFVVAVLLWVSWTDLRFRLISNRAVIFLACLIVPSALFSYKEIFLLPALLTLVVGFLLFLANIIGAGDVKLLSVLMLATPNDAVMPFLFFVSLMGGVLAILGLLFFRQSVSKRGLPYGIAIAGGFILQQILLHPFM